MSKNSRSSVKEKSKLKIQRPTPNSNKHDENFSILTENTSYDSNIAKNQEISPQISQHTVTQMQQTHGNTATVQWLQRQQMIQRDDPPATTTTDLDATLENIENAYSAAYGIHNRQLMAMTAFYTDINRSDSPTLTEQVLTVAASATMGAAIAVIGARITRSIVEKLGESVLSEVVANQIKDNCKDQAKLATQRSLQSSAGREDARFRFNESLVAGIMQSGMTATETFNNNRNRYRTNPNGPAEANALLEALHAQMQNAYDLQYAQAAAQWSTLQTNWAGFAGDRGTLVLEIRCPSPGADVQIISSKLEGLNEATRAALSGFGRVTIRELGLPVRVEGESPHWIWGDEHASDHIFLTGRPGEIPTFPHSGTTAYFLIDRGIARYGFVPEIRNTIPDPLQETSAFLMFNEIFDFPLNRLGNLED